MLKEGVQNISLKVCYTNHRLNVNVSLLFYT